MQKDYDDLVFEVLDSISNLGKVKRDVTLNVNGKPLIFKLQTLTREAQNEVEDKNYERLLEASVDNSFPPSWYATKLFEDTLIHAIVGLNNLNFVTMTDFPNPLAQQDPKQPKRISKEVFLRDFILKSLTLPAFETLNKVYASMVQEGDDQLLSQVGLAPDTASPIEAEDLKTRITVLESQLQDLKQRFDLINGEAETSYDPGNPPEDKKDTLYNDFYAPLEKKGDDEALALMEGLDTPPDEVEFKPPTVKPNPEEDAIFEESERLYQERTQRIPLNQVSSYKETVGPLPSEGGSMSAPVIAPNYSRPMTEQEAIQKAKEEFRGHQPPRNLTQIANVQKGPQAPTNPAWGVRKK